MERRLGRGLGSLLGATELGATDAQAPVQAPRAQLEIAIDQVRPNPFQPRQAFDAEGLEELQESIRLHGILQPVVVRRRADNSYELIAGERRWRAARAAGLSAIPALVRSDVSDGELLEIALVENVQRRDLDALEKARGYARMMQELGLTQEQVAQKVGLKRASVANHLRLLELPEPVQAALSKGLISMGHARALLSTDGERQALALLGRISREGLSVRQVEALARPRPQSAGVEQSPGHGELRPQAPWVAEVQRRLREALGAKVTLLNSPGVRGQIVIEYHGQDDLNRLLDNLAPAPRL